MERSRSCPVLKIRLFLLFFLMNGGMLFAQENLRVMAYNLLHFPDPVPAGRADTFSAIAVYAQPDLLLVCELETAAGADQLLNRGLNSDGGTAWRKADFVPDGSGEAGLQNLVYYRQEKLALYSQNQIKTHVRDISRYVFFFRDPFLAGHQDTTWLDVYVAHLKAGNTPPDVADRSRMVDSLRRYLDGQPPGRNVILGGDFNVYSSLEPAYDKLTDPYASIWLRDPINRPGSWSGNSGMTEVHTQSTRTGLLYGDGSGGGLDDRFDFLLLASPIIWGTGRITYVPGSYKALGNSGGCLNQSVLSCEPNPVSRRIRNALYYMSDHLPVILDLDITYPVFSGAESAAPVNRDLHSWWNGQDLLVSLPSGFAGEWSVYSLDGRRLAADRQSSTAESAILELPVHDIPSGMFVVRFAADSGETWSTVVAINP